ncbi:glycosyl transferase [Bacteroidales bacterium]|nr:glycosyl transferase [Bacteroidales bacterium]
MKQVAVVILNWDGQKLLERFLPFLVKYTPSDMADIIIADNASTDDSLLFLEQNYPHLRIIKLDKNYGFAGGYNRALEEIEHPYTVIINSDIEVTEDWLTNGIGYLESHKEVSALQPKILSYRSKHKFEYAGASGGFMDIYGYPYCRGRILSFVEEDRGQYDDACDVLWASGACLFIRTSIYKQVGGFDDFFFAHQEEIDLCWRMVNRGHRIVCLPTSLVYHVGGATLSKESPRKTFLNFRNNLSMIYKNMPAAALNRVLFVRFFLDHLSILVFLLQFQPSNAWAVIRARFAFYGRIKTLKLQRKENLLLSLPHLSALISQKSLIFAFYLRKVKTFAQFRA